MYSFKGANPTRLYFDALNLLVKEGDECSPRGKLIKELRPASVEFDDPTNRVTFLGSRRVNPFFQLAESLWIISGRADVNWLVLFNKNMKEFSDDGVYFNAPYGERIRTWNKNAAHGVIINPIDQLVDAYIKLLNDKDTRQAVVVISNPMFDNASYTINEHGKDIACNLIFTFKIRHNKLNMTVFNRSNDAHWGLWGANLCQFSTILEVMTSWLKNSGNPEFSELEMGTYCQVTDSLHIYMDSYGCKCTTDVLNYYKNNPEEEVNCIFKCKDEPRMSLNKEEFDNFLQVYWNMIDPYLIDDNYISDQDNLLNLLEVIDDMEVSKVIDEYWSFAIKAMLSYRLVRLGDLMSALGIIEQIKDCQWKISMLFFLKSFIYKVDNSSAEYKNISEIYNGCVKSIRNNLINRNTKELETFDKYLKL